MMVVLLQVICVATSCLLTVRQSVVLLVSPRVLKHTILFSERSAEREADMSKGNDDAPAKDMSRFSNVPHISPSPGTEAPAVNDEDMSPKFVNIVFSASFF